MSEISRRKMLAGLAVAPLAAGLVTKASDLVQASPKGPSSSREKLQARYFPNFELTTHEGKKVRFYDDLMKDKIVVINFMYVKCEGNCVPVTIEILSECRTCWENASAAISSCIQSLSSQRKIRPGH